MATKTLGTSATNSLTALPFLRGYGSGMAAADIATIANAIKDDLNPAHPIIPGAFTAEGLLYVPRRGWLQLYPGDYVAVSSRGFPYLVSADDIANGNWSHS